MRILFAALHNGYYRNLDSVVDELARRGHEICLGAEKRDSAFGGQPIVDRLTSEYANVSAGRVAVREPDTLFLLAKIRLAFDYLRYLSQDYSRASGLLPRARERTPTGILRLTRSPLFRLGLVRRLVGSVLDAIDRAMPPSPAIEAYLDMQRPDLIVITPLMGLVASSQLDLLRSALRRRIATAVVVWSWDHLSSKAIIRDVPDALLVWNETQKQEAIRMHRFPRERIAVTGAQCFDRWFGKTPTRTRDAFMRMVGLPDDKPYVLWACSALLPGSPPEPTIVLRWASHLRASRDPRVRDVSILIRPHPARMEEWAGVDWQALGNIAMFGSTPVDDAARTDYFESLYYSSAVVGITTSAFLDAAIVGRPVMSFLAEDLRQEHEESLHFQHLLDVEEGLLIVGASLAEHEQQLASMLIGPPPSVLARQRKFVSAFIRPHGIDTSATRVVSDTLERIAAADRVGPGRESPIVGRLGLRLLTKMESDARWRPYLLDEREIQKEAQREEWTRVRALDRAKQRAENPVRIAELARKREAKARRMAEKRLNAVKR
jgi:hypothetical protein